MYWADFGKYNKLYLMSKAFSFPCLSTSLIAR